MSALPGDRRSAAAVALYAAPALPVALALYAVSLVRDLGFATARRFDVGLRRPGSGLRTAYPHCAQWDDTPIPTLAEIWEAMAARTDRPRTLIIEIKTSPQEPDESADIGTITRAVVDHVRAHATPAIRPRIIAFDWAVLRLCYTLAPDIPTGHLVIPQALEGDVRRDVDGHSPWTDGYDPVRFGGSVARAVAAHGGTQLSMYHPDITADLIAEAVALGVSVAAWGYARPDEYDALRGSALDSVTVSGPDWRYRDGGG